MRLVCVMNPTTINRFLLLTLGVSAALSGCMENTQSKSSGIGFKGNDVRGGQTVQHQFELSEDPPVKSETHFAAGRLAESQDDLARAVTQYESALHIDPHHRDAEYRLAVVQAKLKHFPEAIIAWKEYIKMTGEDATGYSNLGFCYELSGQMDEAEAAYKKGISRDGKNNPCRVNYGLMLVRLSRMSEGVVQLQTVLSPAEVHYNIASVYERQGNKEAARVEYQKALKADPKFDDAAVRMSELR